MPNWWETHGYGPTLDYAGGSPPPFRGPNLQTRTTPPIYTAGATDTQTTDPNATTTDPTTTIGPPGPQPDVVNKQDLPTTGGMNTPTTPATGNPMDRAYIIQQLTNILQQHGITPGPRGSGPADVEYYADQVLATGGWTGDNAGYWTGRLNSDIGGGTGGAGGPGGINIQTDPSYQWRLGQGMDAIEKSAAARGTLLSGGTLKDLTNYAQGAASQEYQNIFNRNYSLADLGLRGAQIGAAGGGLNQSWGLNDPNAPKPTQFYTPPK